MERHAVFIRNLDAHKNRIQHWHMDHLRLSGIYWALTSLLLLKPGLSVHSTEFNQLSPLSRRDIIEFCHRCMHKESFAFSGNIGHAPHLTFTLSAIQILVILDAMSDDRFNWSRTAQWIASCQDQETGAFSSDPINPNDSTVAVEIDSRFSFCATAALKLLDRLEVINQPKAIEFIYRCRNFDGGFGVCPLAESHAGQVYCCIGALRILQAHSFDPQEHQQLVEWLAWRQLPCGGLNGRPQKLEDVCYSWWVLSSLSMLNSIDCIDAGQLTKFILSCQDDVSGGFSDRPGDMADPFHTLFALAGLSLLGHPDLAAIDPILCMPLS